MSGALIPTNVQVPAHLAKRLSQPSALANAISGGMSDGGPSFPRISIKGSRFRIIESGSETVLPNHTLDVVIVGANPGITKTWYAGKWSPDAEPAGPDCYSMDGVRPAADAPKVQNDLCASCPQNQWGSKISEQGAKIKACSDSKRLAVVAADAPDGPVYLLSVTPAALKGLNQYHKELLLRNIPPEVVRTRVSFDTNASFPKLMFSFGGFLDENSLEVIDGLIGSQEVQDITGESVTQVAEVTIAKPMLVRETSKPKPVEVEVEEAVYSPPAEPAKAVRGFGASTAAPAPKAAEPAARGRKPRAEKEPAAAAVTTASEMETQIMGLLDAMGDDD